MLSWYTKKKGKATRFVKKKILVDKPQTETVAFIFWNYWCFLHNEQN